MRKPNEMMTRLNATDRTVLVRIVGAILSNAFVNLSLATLGGIAMAAWTTAVLVGYALHLCMVCAALLVACALWLVPLPRVSLWAVQFCGAVCDLLIAGEHALDFWRGRVRVYQGAYEDERIEPTVRNTWAHFVDRIWYENRAVEIIAARKQRREA